jgi:hypothetical protein
METTKIVVNRCYGGFGLSRQAVLLARELSGNPKWGGWCIKGDISERGDVCDYDFGHCSSVSRTDTTLVAVVEALGNAANSEYSRLDVVELPKGTAYKIEEYDGKERIETRDSDNWSIA